MTPQESMESEEWQEWKHKHDNEKKQERRLAWAAALFCRVDSRDAALWALHGRDQAREIQVRARLRTQ